MLQALLLDIVEYLQTSNIIEGDGIDAFRDFLPESPDKLVALIEYAGSPDTLHETVTNRSVQVNCRASSAEEAKTLAWQVYNALKATSDTNVINFTESRWGQVYLRQTPFRLATDTTGNVLYVFNVGITTELDPI